MDHRHPNSGVSLEQVGHPGKQRRNRARFNVEDTTEELWDSQMDVHAKGAFLGTKLAIPEMRKIGGRSIVNISSI